MKARAYLEQASGLSIKLDPATRRFGDPRQNFQQRALPGSVLSHDADGITEFEIEVNIAQGPNRVIGLHPAPPQFLQRDPHRFAERVAQRPVGSPPRTEAVLLAE